MFFSNIMSKDIDGLVNSYLKGDIYISVDGGKTHRLKYVTGWKP